MRLLFLKIKKFGEFTYPSGIVPFWWVISLVVILAVAFSMLGEGADGVQIDPDNLTANGNFETLEEGKPASWKEDKKGAWKVSEEEPYEGEKCMETIQSWSWLWQDISVKPKKWYILEAQVRSDITFRVRQIRRDYENTFLTMECLDKDGRVLRREWGITMAFPLWHKRQTSVYTPEGVRKIRVKLAKRMGQGRVWFDDVRLIRSSWLEHFSPEKLDKTFRFTLYGLVAMSFIGIIVRRVLKSKSREGS